MEQLSSGRPLETVFADVMDNQTRLVELFVPTDASEQKEAFLAGEAHSPHHYYNRLESIDFDGRNAQLQDLAVEVSNHPEISQKYRGVYNAFIQNYQLFNEFARSVATLHNPETSEAEKQTATERYMQLNIELFGEPNQEVYASAVQELHTLTQADSEDPARRKIQTELLALLPEVKGSAARFYPSEETKQWVRTAAQELYGNIVRWVPEREEPFSPTEIAEVFNDVITHEFGEAAEGWEAAALKAKAIVVSASEKLVKIPENRKPVSAEQLRGLVVHELGVHMLRAVTGSETDLLPLGLGLSNYSDSEEGLAVIMEQAVKGEFRDPKTTYPLIAGLMHYEGKDFRDCFEIMWRQKVLESAKTNKPVDEKTIEKARSDAYNAVMRITRGTDTLPWFKDLAYYNGQEAMWRYLEKIRGDDLQFSFLLLGKADPSQDEHRRVLLETKSI